MAAVALYALTEKHRRAGFEVVAYGLGISKFGGSAIDDGMTPIRCSSGTSPGGGCNCDIVQAASLPVGTLKTHADPLTYADKSPLSHRQ